jgi:hypothetical protein
MKNGIIYVIANWTINSLKYLNLVEFFKFVGRQLNPNKHDQSKVTASNRIATDIFILTKWIFVIILWKLSATNGFLVFSVWYLIVTNVYTYFYYHIWDKESLNPDNFTIDRTKRRFVNLMLAVSYSTFCFAYLYQIPYFKEFDWSNKIPVVKLSLMYSFSNSLAANYSDVKPITDFGNILSTIQLLITFFFLTIILSKTIPQTNSTI